MGRRLSSQSLDLDQAARGKIVILYRDHSIKVKDLAERYGCGESTISKILTEAGVMRPRKHGTAPVLRWPLPKTATN